MNASAPHRDDRYFDAAIETSTPAELDAAQEAAVLDACSRAYDDSPVHRAIWEAAGLRPDRVTTLREFTARVPFTCKDVVREHRSATGDPFGGLRAAAGRVDLFSSSGTTGDRTFHTSSPADLAWMTEQSCRNFWSCGVRPRDVFAYALPPWARPFTAHHLALQRLDVDTIPLDWVDLGRTLLSFQALEPTGYAFLIPPLVGALEEGDRRIDAATSAFASLERMVWAGDALTPATRRRIESMWEIELFDSAGLGDLVVLCTECGAHDGMHVWADLFYIEVVDQAAQTGAAARRSGRGELVITSLHSGSMPHIRWRSGDVVDLLADPCSCGRTHPRIRVLGRVQDCINVGGIDVFPREIQEEVESIAGWELGVFQVGRPAGTTDRLLLRLPHLDSPSADAEALELLSTALRTKWGVDVDALWVQMEALLAEGPPHKVPRTFEIDR